MKQFFLNKTSSFTLASWFGTKKKKNVTSSCTFTNFNLTWINDQIIIFLKIKPLGNCKKFKTKLF